MTRHITDAGMAQGVFDKLERIGKQGDKGNEKFTIEESLYLQELGAAGKAYAIERGWLVE